MKSSGARLGLIVSLDTKTNSTLPVLNLNVNYRKPAKYDDLLTIRTKIMELPQAKIAFDHEVYNSDNELLTTGRVELVFVSKETMRPKRAPEDFIKTIETFF